MPTASSYSDFGAVACGSAATWAPGGCAVGGPLLAGACGVSGMTRGGPAGPTGGAARPPARGATGRGAGGDSVIGTSGPEGGGAALADFAPPRRIRSIG